MSDRVYQYNTVLDLASSGYYHLKLVFTRSTWARGQVTITHTRCW
jgi:hypothetical protein